MLNVFNKKRAFKILNLRILACANASRQKPYKLKILPPDFDDR
eukprot:UN01367